MESLFVRLSERKLCLPDPCYNAIFSDVFHFPHLSILGQNSFNILITDPQGEPVYLQLNHNPVTDIEMQQQLLINNVFSFKLTHLGFVRKSHKPSILAVHLPGTNDVRISIALQKMNQISSGYSLS